MAKKSNTANDTSQNYKKYGVPFYGAVWVPPSTLRSTKSDGQDESVADSQNYVVLTGGGGEGRSGIPNAIVIAHFDFSSNTLSDQPVFKLGLGSDLPYRMTIHPGGDGIVCCFENGCRLYEWDKSVKNDDHKIGLKESGQVLAPLENVGQQLAVAFNNEGSVLAAGGEDGNLRVFKWPSMDIIFDDAESHGSVKDLTFSPDGKYLVSVGKGGPGRVWDVSSSTAVASLAKENDEIFAGCRFSPLNDNKLVLYIAAVTGRGTNIIKWDATSWKRMGSKQILRDSVAAFNVSADGKLLAIGSQGDIFIVNSTSLRIHTTVKKAHLGFVTSLMFSHDSRALLSTSMDSSARVTLVKDKKDSGGLSLSAIVLIILLAIVIYFMQKKDLFHSVLP